MNIFIEVKLGWDVVKFFWENRVDFVDE